MKPAAPLAGLGVVVTRDEPPGGALSGRLTAAGARVLCWPATKIAPPADPQPLARALAALESFDWLVLTSVHAVAAVAARRATLPAALRLAVVGASTAAAAEALGWRVDLLPSEFHAEALLASFAAAGDDQRVAGRRILFPASDRAAAALPDGLAALGAEVVRVEGYRTMTSGSAGTAALDGASCLGEVARGAVDVVTFASPSAVAGLAAALGEAALADLLAHAAVAAIGPTTAGALVRRGRVPDAIASPATLDGLVAAALAAHLGHTERKLPCRS